MSTCHHCRSIGRHSCGARCLKCNPPKLTKEWVNGKLQGLGREKTELNVEIAAEETRGEEYDMMQRDVAFIQGREAALREVLALL